MERAIRTEHKAGFSRFWWIGACLIVGLFVLSLGGLHDALVRSALDAAPQEEVLVQRGESLWSLAEGRTVGDASVSEVVRWVMEANSLESSCLQPGDVLVMPVASS